MECVGSHNVIAILKKKKQLQSKRAMTNNVNNYICTILCHFYFYKNLTSPTNPDIAQKSEGAHRYHHHQSNLDSYGHLWNACNYQSV